MKKGDYHGSFYFLCFILFLVILLIASGLYVVRQQTVAIIERFGKYQLTSASGIHLRLPFELIKLLRVSNYVCFNRKLLSKLRQRTMFL